MSAALHLVYSRPEQPQETGKCMQDGFVAVPNSVEDALLGSSLTHRQERVFRAILRKTVGFGKETDFIATKQLADMTGFDESDVRKALNDMIDMGMIIRGRRTKFGTQTTPVLTPESWNLKQGESPRLPPQTGRITPDKQGELPPTIDKSTDNKNILVASKTDDMVEPEKITKNPADKIPACPHQKIIDAYHAALPTLPAVCIWTEARQKQLQARWRERCAAGKYKTQEEGLDYWTRFFAHVATSDFLCGRTDSGFIADLQWLTKLGNFAKVAEGRYHREVR